MKEKHYVYDKEIAVIFRKAEKELANHEKISVFIPCKIVTGRYDREKKLFIDSEGIGYSHTLASKTGLCFGIRRPLKAMAQCYHIKNVSLLKKKMLRGVRCFDYYYYTEDGTLDKLQYVAQDKITTQLSPIMDVDLNRYIKEKKQMKSEVKPTLNTKELTKAIQEKVIGQEEAIQSIVSVLWQNSKNDKKKNMLIIGPTGVGKTEIIRLLAKKLEIPLLIVDASSLTQTGIVGESVNDIFKNLLSLCQNDVKKAEQAIIVLDELDKLSRNSCQASDVITTGVQEELLKVMEDGIYYVETKNGITESKRVPIDTKGITFIGMGYFEGINQINVDRRMGFNQDVTKAEKKYRQVTSEDLIQFGLKAELVGRLENIISLRELGQEDLINILKSPNSDAIAYFQHIFHSLGMDLLIEEEVFIELAKQAMKKKTGARGLNSALEELLKEALYEISGEENAFSELKITKETVSNPKKYILTRKKLS